jgi:hypothetical protein
LLSLDEFLRLFPPLFGILLCLLSSLDHLWIGKKIERELESADMEFKSRTVRIANGAASLNVHIVNVILFVAGALLAVFDWPGCELFVPIVICIVMFAVVVYDLVIILASTPFEIFDVKPEDGSARDGSRLAKSRAGMWVMSLAPAWRLRLEQIGFNCIIILLIIGGIALGGARDTKSICSTTHGLPSSQPTQGR